MADTVNTGVAYAQRFEEFEACVGAGLDLWRWVSGEYPTWFRAQTLAWWRLHGLVRLHTADATRPKPKPGAK